MNQTAEKIMTVAEQMIRRGGYHAFSFRQIAAELDIKSASIHYHFSSKELLGVEITRSYTERFMTILGDPLSHKAPLEYYLSAFQQSFSEHKAACLCGVLAAEAGQLPDTIKEVLEKYTASNVKWLSQAISATSQKVSARDAENLAKVFFSALEGAIIFSALAGDSAHLDAVSEGLKSLI